MDKRAILLLAITVIAVISVFSMDRIPQDMAYHCFSDQDPILGIPNFWNVLSNLPFLFVGIYAFKEYLKHYRSSSQFLINFIMALGILLTFFGSSYYHWKPNNDTLLWDRLPMTLIFMSFFTSVLARYISPQWYKIGLKFLVPIGILSVTYWYFTEEFGVGDLRLYALVQFLPILLIPTIMFLYKDRHLPLENMLWIMYLYFEAKIFELFDHETHYMFQIISGHSIKHLFAAAACYFMIRRELNIIKKLSMAEDNND